MADTNIKEEGVLLVKIESADNLKMDAEYNCQK